MLDLIYPIGLQILLPIGFLVWQWQERSNSWLEWWLKTILIGSYLLGLTLFAFWLVLPWYWAYVYLGVFGLETIWSFRYATIIDRRWHRSWKNSLRVASFAMAIAFCIHFLLSAGLAHLPPEEPPIKPSLPLKKGGYYIANSGHYILLNTHLAFLDCPRIGL